jgi:hypothetical protein
MVKQPGLFSPEFGATSSHVITKSPQNVAVKPRNQLDLLDGGNIRNILDITSYGPLIAYFVFLLGFLSKHGTSTARLGTR